MNPHSMVSVLNEKPVLMFASDSCLQGLPGRNRKYALLLPRADFITADFKCCSRPGKQKSHTRWLLFADLMGLVPLAGIELATFSLRMASR
ncbi:MAG: hypothetical protein IPJ12_05940 [Betaproteobacteria bacterium]|nr:hypothetical protein [Betaproteobacteria bacterium]